MKRLEPLLICYQPVIVQIFEPLARRRLGKNLPPGNGNQKIDDKLNLPHAASKLSQ
jgi:hypothetical protein